VSPPASDAPTIGRFRLRREIGRGSMGVVYEAHDPLLERTVAIKTIRIAFAATPEEFAVFERRFMAEARIAARLSHPGIVVVHDVGQDEASGELYIAMEHLEGRTLANMVQSGVPLPWQEALRIVRQVADALHHAHEQGVVHRDLKPANVMLLASGQIKIMDFGIARVQAEGAHLTAAGQSIGTPLFVSPEQIRGEAVDGRSDLFSLGAVAYSLLTGRSAFAADSIAGVVARVVGADPPPPSSVVPGTPPAVDGVMARALAKDPADRYQDGAALARDIDAILVAPPDAPAKAARPADPVDGSRTQPIDSVPAHSHAPAWLVRSAVVVVPLAALLLVVALAAAWWASSAPQPAPAPVVARPAAVPPSATETREVSRDPPPAPGSLAVRLDRLPRGAAVRIWVDRSLVSELRSGQADAKDQPVPLGRDGSGTLNLEPGGHDLEVEVAWGGRRLRSRIWGSFKPGVTRRLRVRAGGLLKKSVSLAWE
jgi:hypothetical protein